MKKTIFSLITVVMLIFMTLPAVNPSPVLATEDVTVFADDFGSGGDINDVTTWDVVGYADWDVDSDGGGGGGKDAALRTDCDTRYLRLRSHEYVEKHNIDTTGLTNIHLEYTWGQDTDSDDSDDGDLVVQWKLSADTDIPANWNLVNRHNLTNNNMDCPGEHFVDAALPGSAEGTSIDIRFWGDTPEDKDEAWVDNVIVSGDPGCTTYYRDNDDDDYGQTGDFQCLFAPSGNYTAIMDGDCNDNNAAINPGATEVCDDGIDNDCDGLTDCVDTGDCPTYYRDNDDDDYGQTGDSQCLYDPSGNYTATMGGDCDDNNAAINPGATEVCNGYDDDCDGETDEEGATGCTIYYKDVDNDTYGVTGDSKCLCAEADPYDATQGGDCDDNDAAINPGAAEVCDDGKDNDCDGLVDCADPDCPSNVEIQLAMILDGSGSIGSSEWTTIVNGLAAAVENPGCIPQDCSVELTVIQFSTDAQLEVGPVIITPSNAGDVADDIRDISQMGGYTCISCGICLAADMLAASSNFDPDIKQALNLVTDGEPNRCSCYDGDCGYEQSGCSGTSGQASAECARAYAITTLGMTVDQDEIDAEGIGITNDNRNWLRDSIVWPQPGYIAPPFDQGPGWVRVVESAGEFAGTICEKFEITLYGRITAHKFNDLNGDCGQDGGEWNLSGWTMTLYSGSDCSGTPLDSDVTNGDGNVVFAGLDAGTYSVKETPKDGWTNSTALCQDVTIDTGESATLNFGNYQPPGEPPYLEVDKSASPDPNCGEATVTLNVTGAGDPGWERFPLDVILIIDRSGSMSGAKMTAAKQAAKDFVDLLDPDKDRVGLVSYSGDGGSYYGDSTLDEHLTNNFANVKDAIDDLTANGATCIACGLELANNEFSINGGIDSVWGAILLTDGIPNRPNGNGSDFNEADAQLSRDLADAFYDMGGTLYTIGLGISPNISYYFLDDLLASGHDYNPGDPAGHPYPHDGLAFVGGGHYYHAPTTSQLEFIFEEITEEITNIAGTDVVVTEVLPSGVHYVGGSAVPAPDSIIGQTLTWNLGNINIGDTETMTFNVTFDDPGYQLVDEHPETRVDYNNYLGDPAFEVFPETHITVSKAPVAAFNATPTSCCAPLEVNFTDQSTGNPTSWAWDFGDGNTSTDQHPSHTYNGPGIYTVSLNVTNACGWDDETKENYITVGGLPSADFNATPTNGCAPLRVNFTDLSDGNGKEIISWSWDFGDGGTSTSQNPSHTYTDPGTYTVSLTVTNACGEGTETRQITARDCPPPTPPRGGGGCPDTKYLTVDWEGNNTTEPLYSNDKLAVDLLGPSFDLSHNLFLEQGTHAPVVYKTTHYLIIVRELEDIPALPDNTEAIVVFNITPADATFDKDIFLTLGVDELPANALNVTMAYYDDVNDVWVFLESEAGGPSGVAELTLSAPINHFSIFGVLAEIEPTPPPPPAHFVASGLSIEPSVERIWEPVTFVTKTGESVTITANVANDGWQEGTYTVELKLNGETVDTKMVTVGAGQSKPVSFTRAGLDYGQYEVEVAGLSGEFTTSRTITWWLILVIIAAIGLIIWGVVWGRRRRRRAAQEG